MSVLRSSFIQCLVYITVYGVFECILCTHLYTLAYLGFLYLSPIPYFLIVCQRKKPKNGKILKVVLDWFVGLLVCW